MNFRKKMLISLRNKVQANIHEHLRSKLYACLIGYDILVELEYTTSIPTIPSLIVDKCWSYEF